MIDLEERTNGKDIREELDVRYSSEETPSQSLLKRMFAQTGFYDKTDLSNEEIEAISQFLFICERFKLSSGFVFIDYILKLKISKERKGRTEGFNLVSKEQESKAQARSVFTLLGGRMPSI